MVAEEPHLLRQKIADSLSYWYPVNKLQFWQRDEIWSILRKKCVYADRIQRYLVSVDRTDKGSRGDPKEAYASLEI